jgi:hypothetical protein
MRVVDPEGFEKIAQYEKSFGITIHRTRSVHAQADRGTVLPGARTKWRDIAMSAEFNIPITRDPWELPAGAYGDSTGPT